MYIILFIVYVLQVYVVLMLHFDPEVDHLLANCQVKRVRRKQIVTVWRKTSPGLDQTLSDNTRFK